MGPPMRLGSVFNGREPDDARAGLELGAHLNLSLLPPLLAPRYHGRVAPGFGVFANLRPAG